jgi:4-amino-4-deoxy-L-arabinose transferase-like glycosyltransferase
MDRPSRESFPASWRAHAAAWLLAAFCVIILSAFVLTRRGNLAWDDADYLRRGLAIARASLADGPAPVAARFVGWLHRERPKPPLLVGWIAIGVLAVGKQHFDALLILASVVPFGLLSLAVWTIARKHCGGLAGLLALTFLLASPRALSFGARAMVETFLGLWILITLRLAAAVVERPSRRAGMKLGIATGLALLTKLTTVLLLAGAVVPSLWWMVRADSGRAARLRSMGWAALTCALLAGPWYARNAVPAFRFAALSSRFNELAEGRSDVIGATDRLTRLASDLPGWPLLGWLALLGLAAYLTRRGSASAQADLKSGPPARRFTVLAGAGALAGSALLLIPTYFDSRFLLPIWPSLDVALGGMTAGPVSRLSRRGRLAMAAGLAACLAASTASLWREPRTSTPWAVASLIDRLVDKHGVATLANVGDVEFWNVCKTGLVNELRVHPEGCFVLEDLSAESAEGLRSRLPGFDAVVVLDPSALPLDATAAAPRLNRASRTILEVLRSDPGLVLVDGLPRQGLPPLLVFTRSRAPDHPDRRAARDGVPGRPTLVR